MVRPREFNSEEVLAKAMLVFWENGFRSATFEQLTEAMELRKQSVYGAFGDKRLLFIKSLELYRVQTLKSLEEAVSQPGSTIAILEGVYRYATRPPDERDCPAGCLIVNTSLEFGLSDKDIALEVSKLFDGFERIFARLVRRGQQSGEMTTRFDSRVLAQHIVNTLSGLRVLEKTGISPDKIDNILSLSISLVKS